MATFRRVPFIWRGIAAIAIVTAVVMLARITVSAVHDLGLFELDGNALDDPAVAGADWSTVNFGGGGALARTGVLSDPHPVSIFTGGGSKDIHDISQWKHKDGSVPDKDDITNAYAAAYSQNGDLIIYFGADRFANDGDAQLGFWFFQQNVTLNPTGGFNGTHTVGDLLVLANFSNGGAVATIEVLEWVGSGGNAGGGTLQTVLAPNSAKCGPALVGDMVCAISNPEATASPWPYTPKQGNLNEFPTFSFFEGGINVSAIFAGTTPPCFASFLAETRSSTSPTAVLKDFVLGAFPVCGINIQKACTDGTVNANETGFVYTFNGIVTNTGFGALHNVVVVDDAGTPGNTGDDIKISLGDLGPQESKSFSGTFESTLNPATNQASVTASTDINGGATVSDTSDPATCPPVNRNPAIDVTKVCTTSLVVIDNKVVVQVNFSGQVCAGPQIGLTNVTVTDDRGTADPSDDQQVFSTPSLPKDTCQPYTGSYLPRTTFTSDPSFASFTDTVTARGTAPLGFGTVEDTASATCPLCPPEPH
jgi:hypothetical protein